ncbi:MAG: alpha/beta fold hydrolase [Stackebrandtia sp.]
MRRKTWISSVVAAAALAMLIGVGVTAGADSSAGDLHECAEATERCEGTIEVPLDWSDPSGEQIEVAFAFVPHGDQSRPAEGAILANAGGPGYAIGSEALFAEVLGPVLDTQDLFVVDPRGHGKSGELRCEGLDKYQPETIQDCAQQLGDRVQFFTSDQVAADVNAVREALGLPAVTFYGNSYGSVLAQAFATRFPEHTRAVLMDSGPPTDDDGYWALTPGLGIREGIARLGEVCELSEACRALPGEAEERWSELVAHLRDNPDPDIDLELLFRSNIYVPDPAIIREANAAAAAYMDGDPEPLRRVAEKATSETDDPVDPTFAGMLATTCGDAAFAFDRDASPQERRAQLDDYYDAEKPFDPYMSEEVITREHVEANEWCVNWPTPRESPIVPPGADYPDVPVLIIHNQLDVVPSWWAPDLAERFPQGQAQQVPFGQHASTLSDFPTGLCLRDHVRAFVADPGPMPALECSAENYRALGSFPVDSGQLPPADSPDLDDDQQRLTAAVFAAAADAVARRNPESKHYTYGGVTEEPGLRGGTVRLPEDSRNVTLEEVSFVEDLAVTGDVKIADDNTATTTLTAVAADGTEHALELTWTAFQPLDATQVSGTFDGQPFHATIPNH